MKISIHTSTIQPMIELCRKHKLNQITQIELENILSHHDYDVEFRRYLTKGLPVSNITKEEFIDYFMNINLVNENDIKNPRLKDKHKLWMKFFSDIDSFTKNNIELLTLSEEDINYVESLINNSFPKHLLEEIEDIKCLFTLSIGNSMGYPYENYIHFDYLNLGLIEDKEVFLHFIAHEIHHIILSRIMNKYIKKDFTPLEYFLIMFSYEGLAVKFCNNGSGSFTKAIHKVRENIGMNKDDFTYYEKEFPSMFNQFIADYKLIKNNNVSLEETDILIRENWMNPNIKSFIDQSYIKVSHYRNYYLGMQLYGKIYEDIGLSNLFDLLLNPDKLVIYFEQNIIDEIT